MGFRDDNEALRARTRAAEQRAERAESERERMERELAEAKANDQADAQRIAELEKRLAKLEPRPKAASTKKNAAPALAVAAVAVAVMAGAVGFVMLSAGNEKAPSVSAPATLPATLPAPVAEPAPAPAAPVSPLERVRLAGVVRSAGGVEGLEAGDGCVADRALGNAGFETLQIRCGAGDGIRTVFDGAESTEAGMTNTSGTVAEVSTGPGTVARTMAYNLTGTWSGPQAQIQMDPAQRALRVWRSGLSARDVLVHLESASGSTGTVVLDQSGVVAPIARGTTAKLVVEGEVPEPLGELDTDDCVLRTEPVARLGGSLTARIVARCGQRALYGALRSGWVPAPAEGGVIGPVEDAEMSAADTDPAMTYTGETLTLAEPDWRLVFRIEPHPACTLVAGDWIGAVRAADGTLTDGARLTDGELILPGGETIRGEEDMRCHEGVARWTDAAGEVLLEGHFGPAFATFVGRLGDGSLLELYATD